MTSVIGEQVPGAHTGMDLAGPRLRRARQDAGRTLEDVAGAAGVSKGFLSLVERGLSRVSVPVLLRLCGALGIPLGALFDFPDGDVVPPGGGAPLQMGGLDIVEHLLTPADEPQVQVMHTVLAPGGGSGGAYSLDSTTVFAFVLRGELVLHVDGVKRQLGAGSSTTFSARAQHEWHNGGPGETVVLWVISPPLPHGSLSLPAGSPAVDPVAAGPL